MNMEQIQDLMHRLEKSSLTKIVYKKGDFELQLEKGTLLQHAEPARFVETSVEHRKEKETKKEEPAGSFVTSPMVGTFYASPSPTSSHFVKVGDTVHAGTVICIVEAMKVMNEVKAGMNGKIAEMLVQSGHPVEFGARLFRIIPS